MSADVVHLDVLGAVVRLPYEVVAELRAAAATHAAVSSRHRDLSLVLDRALASGSGTLTGVDLRVIAALVEERPSLDGPLRELVDAEP